MAKRLAAVLLMNRGDDGSLYALLTMRGMYNWEKGRDQNGFGLWQPTAMGTVEEGESLDVAHLREFAEETHLSLLFPLVDGGKPPVVVESGQLTCFVKVGSGDLGFYGKVHLHPSCGGLRPFTREDFLARLQVVEPDEKIDAIPVGRILMRSESADVVKKAFELLS